MDSPSRAENSSLLLKQLLKKLYEVWPHRFEVYPNPDGEIAIDARNDRGSAVLVLCEPGGEVLCLVHTHGEQQSNRYPRLKTFRMIFCLEPFPLWS